MPGPFNSITDVAGVSVDYSTLISGDGPLVVGLRDRDPAQAAGRTCHIGLRTASSARTAMAN